MKLQTIIAITCLLAHVSIAQTNDYTITCPENTFLGAFACTDIDDIPSPINTIEAAMASPYNIQIDGELPANAKVSTEDNGPIFFCEDDLRTVTRELIFYLDTFEPWFTPLNEIARCSFTIETIVDVTPIDFIAPADYEVNCDNPENYPSEVTFFTGHDCFVFNQDKAFYTDETVTEGNNNIIIRTWRTTDVCGNISEPEIQTIITSCGLTCNKPTAGTFNCGN